MTTARAIKTTTDIASRLHTPEMSPHIFPVLVLKE
jgi:hypothetical protein